ncbi:PAS domain-containing protein [Halorubrum cibi]|uniref:histidine kinase n=1 Tax=Halorubrum cibi TaxID=413815 RepID=A0A521DZT5_9EURY|nr:PAS domain-containing protein [Halorubrum cibi]SMO77132.1 PAS domain S-box-containing protein [Halorubrum cibi]
MEPRSSGRRSAPDVASSAADEGSKRRGRNRTDRTERPLTDGSVIDASSGIGAAPDRFLAAVAVDGEVLFAGPSMPALIGGDRAAIRGNDFLEYVHPNERDEVSDALSAVANERRVTHRIRRANGGYAWVESVVDDDLAPEFGGRVVTGRRIDVERTFPERFREFLEYGTDIVTVVDADGRVRYESPSVEGVLGYEQGSLVGRSPLGYVHPDDRDRITAEFYEALADPERVEALEYRYRTADGDWVWLESRVRALPDDAAVGRLVINSRDVSERKRRERRLADRNERLDRFASIVSHDLRNPLSVIRGSMEMARLKDDTEPLERGERATDRIEQLVSELLTLARQGSGMDEPTEFSLEGVVNDAWGTAGDEKAELVVVDDARIRGDRGRLRQAFENLFRNSVEHGSTGSRAKPGDSVEHGSTSSRIPAESSDSVEHGSTGSRTASGDSVEYGSTDSPADSGNDALTVVVSATDRGIVVADDGPGISPEHRPDVFDSGFTTRTNGTGYGLDIVREIVDSHGWEIDVVEPNSAIEADPRIADRIPDGARFAIRAPTPATVDAAKPWIER